MLRSDTCVIIPCYNEGSSIGQLVQAVCKVVPSVWVIDDGSTDATAKLAESQGARVLQHRERLGKGRALNTGLLKARAEGFKFALTMDGDGQHAPSDIATFLIAAERFDLVVGNRMHSRDEIPLVRRLTNQFMSDILSLFLGVHLPDSQCGFRLVRIGALPDQMVECDAFEVESELLVAILKRNGKVGFVDISVIYGTEQSKIRPVRDAFRWVTWLIRTVIRNRKPRVERNCLIVRSNGPDREVLGDSPIP